MNAGVKSELLIADSFRVRVQDGVAQARGFCVHLDRFTESVRATHTEPDDLPIFLRRAREEIAAYGEGNPRLELHEDGALRLLLRPLPALRTEIELRTAGHIERDRPEHKGPNIARFADLNRELGAEALLLDEQGFVAEGATTAIVWWEDDALCSAASTARVTSVTERILTEAALEAGFEVVKREITPDELVRHEVWAVNALHGIRPVRHIDGRPTGALSDSARLEAFRAALDASWEPVLG